MSEKQFEVVRVEIAKLDAKPGDTVLLKMDLSRVPIWELEGMRETMRRYVPAGVKVLVLDDSIDVQLIKEADA
jgi:hypothetical protein